MRFTFEQLADALLVTDDRGRFLDANQAAQQLLGYSSNDLLDASLSEVLGDDEGAAGYLARFGEGRSWRDRMELRRRNGSMVLVDVQGNTVHGKGGPVLVSILREIAEADDRAFQTGRSPMESHLAAIVESSQDAIFSKTLDGIIQSWNQGAERMYGYTAAEVIGCPVSMLAPLERKDEITGIMQRLARGEAIRHFRTQRVTKDGRTIDVSLSISPVHDETGAIVAAASITRDVTEERRAQAELQMARQQLAIITKAGASGLSIQDATGRRIYANDAAARMSGYPNAETFLGAPVDEVLDRFELRREDGSPFPPDELPGQRALRGEDRAEALIRVRDKVTGDDAWSLVTSTALKDDRGDVQYVVNVFRHITEQKRVEQELRYQKVLLEAQSEASDAGIVVISPDGEIVSANTRFGQLWGIPQEVLRTRSNEATTAFVRDRLEDPEAFLERTRFLWEHMELDARDEIALKDGRIIERYTRPLLDDAGGSFGRIAFFRDVTVERKREEGQRFLAQSSKELVSTLDYQSTLSRIAEMAVPKLADWCTVDVLEPDGSLRLLAVAHSDPTKVQWAREFRRKFPIDMSAQAGIPNIIRTGRSELYPTIEPEMLEEANLDEEQLEVIRQLKLSSLMMVPLVARGRTHGVLSFVFAESGRSYTEDDLRLAEDLAGRAAMALDNARLYRERDSIARTLQRGLLPGPLPQIPGIELAARYQAAGEGIEVGGDFYDAFDTEDGCWALVVGDVCGKGPHAAALMGAARHTIRAAAIRERRPSTVLSVLNAALQQQAKDQWFCTVCYVRVHPQLGGARLTVSVGGHPLPAVLRADGTVEHPGKPGTLLGVFEDIELHDARADLHPGDALVLFTDGLTDAKREEGPGHPWLSDVLSRLVGLSANDIAARLERAVLDLQPTGLVDDLAVLVAKVKDEQVGLTPDPADVTQR
jgi:PAS domain S-box-containing protein